MVEINNQRKAFLDMLAWSEGIDNGRQKTRNHGYDVITGGELFTDYLPTPPSQTGRQTQNSIQRRRTLPASSRWWMSPVAKAGLKVLSESRDAWHFSQQIKERGALPRLIAGYPSGNRPLQQLSGLHWPGAGADCLSIRLTA